MASIGLLLASYAQAQDDAFKRGLKAREDKKWESVVQEMRAAVQARSQESTAKVRSGLSGLINRGGTEYLPHFFLGEALFNSGDCVGAITEWETSQRQAAVLALPEYAKQILNGYAECDKKGVLPPGKYDTVAARTLQQMNDINALAASVSALGQANADIWRSDQGMREQYERASSEMQSARTRYMAGRSTRDLRDFTEAGLAADRARSILIAVEGVLNTAIESQRSLQALAKDVGDAIGAAEALDRAVEAKPRTPAWTPAIGAMRQDSRDAIARARERLNEGIKTSNPPALTAARMLAVDASTRLKQVLDELTRGEKDALQRELGNALARALESFSLLDNAAATLNRLAAERPAVLPPDKAVERESVEREMSAAKRRFEAARKSDNVAAIVDAARLAATVKEKADLLIGAFGPLTIRDRGVHPVLEEGARLFFSGEYQQAAAALEPGEVFQSEVPLTLHVHLFRAAALYELFLKSHEADASLRAQAVAELEHCRNIDSAFRPDARAFSPRFLAFYQSGGASAATGSGGAR
jgi:hypothetical protein